MGGRIIMNDITLYDLMAEPLRIELSREDSGEYTLKITDDNYDLKTIENEINPDAIDSFADFCQQFLDKYNAAKGDGLLTHDGIKFRIVKDKNKFYYQIVSGNPDYKFWTGTDVISESPCFFNSYEEAKIAAIAVINLGEYNA